MLSKLMNSIELGLYSIERYDIILLILTILLIIFFQENITGTLSYANYSLGAVKSTWVQNTRLLEKGI